MNFVDRILLHFPARMRSDRIGHILPKKGMTDGKRTKREEKNKQTPQTRQTLTIGYIIKSIRIWRILNVRLSIGYAKDASQPDFPGRSSIAHRIYQPCIRPITSFYRSMLLFHYFLLPCTDTVLVDYRTYLRTSLNVPMPYLSKTMKIIFFWTLFLSVWVTSSAFIPQRNNVLPSASSSSSSASLGESSSPSSLSSTTLPTTTSFRPSEQRAPRRSNLMTKRRKPYVKTDQLWLQRLRRHVDDGTDTQKSIGSSSSSSSILWIDLENVRGKTGFGWTHEHVLDLTAQWARYHNLTEGQVVVVADHGSLSQAIWDSTRDLAVVFSGNVFAKADDVLARHVGLEFLLHLLQEPGQNDGNIEGSATGDGHSIIVTADTELQSRCRRACKHASYHILDPAKFVEELEEMALMIQEEGGADEDDEEEEEEEARESSSSSTDDVSLQEHLQLGQLDKEIRLRAQILDVQVQLGRGKNVRKKNLTNKRRKKLQLQLDHLQHQLLRRGPSLLDQVISLNDDDRHSQLLGLGNDDSTILKAKERDLILKRWNEIQHRSFRKEQTGDRIVLAEQLRRQLIDSSRTPYFLAEEGLAVSSPAKAFVQFFNQQYYEGESSTKTLPLPQEKPSTSSYDMARKPATMELLGDPFRNPLLGLEQLQIVAISDTHGFEGQLLTDTEDDVSAKDSSGVSEILPQGDILLHLGDFTAEGSSEIEQNGWQTLDTWLAKQPHPIKIVIRGNHDPWKYNFEQSGAWYITEPATISLNEHLSLGVVPYGSSRKLTASNSIPTQCDIFASHVPPLKTLDQTFTGKAAGSGFLNRVVTSMGKGAPRLWICGHIHEGRGVAQRQFGGKTTTTVINAANANRGRATHLDHGAVVVQIHQNPTKPVQVLQMEDKTIAKKVPSSDKFFRAKMEQDANNQIKGEDLLLAVDLGLKSGVALFGSRGKLLRYEQFHFERDSLHDTAQRLLTKWEQEAFQPEGERAQEHIVPPRVTHVAIEGADGYMLRAWADAATDLSILRVLPEEWRAELLLERERTSGSNAKAASRLIARQVVEDFGVMPRHEGKFPTDVAEAVCLGLYVSSKLGWVDRAGGPVIRRYTNGNIIVPK